jgi:hypothetical protein
MSVPTFLIPLRTSGSAADILINMHVGYGAADVVNYVRTSIKSWLTYLFG